MDRNEILANFQACTGIEDISECIAQLEQTDWNLNEAVTVALAANDTSDIVENPLSLRSIFPQLRSTSGPTVSTNGGRMIEFIIKMHQIKKHIILDETATFADLRRLAAVEFEIPENEVKFDGWPGVDIVYLPDETDFRSLDLPKTVYLRIRTAHTNGATGINLADFGLKEHISAPLESDFDIPCSAFRDVSELSKLNTTFILEVTEKRTKKVFNLTVGGTKTFEELRHDTHSLTDIPPSKQIWRGLSEDASLLSPDRALGSLNLTLPVHKCTVMSDSTTANDDSDEVMEVDDFDEASTHIPDDMLYSSNVPTMSRLRPLMPNEAKDEFQALVQFEKEFSSRYSEDAPMMPSFYIGTLDAAIQEAFSKPARERKLLAVYLHHDKSIQSNVFCSQLLCAPSVVEYMANHCVIWAWDVTSEYNKKRLLDMCSRHLGSGVADTVKRISRDGFPMLALAQGRGRSCEVNTIIQGNTSLDELMAKLIKAVEDAEAQKQEDIRMEELSEARERIKREQERAYEESLKQDKEKQKKIEAEKAELQRQLEEEKRLEEEENKKISQLSQIIPAEPDPKCGKPIARIRFRPPSGGDVITRTFLASEKLQGLLNFVGSLGYLSDKYRVITSYPKRDISSLDSQISLKDHKLFPQETLIIEERID